MSDARTRLGNPFVPAGPRKEFPKKRIRPQSNARRSQHSATSIRRCFFLFILDLMPCDVAQKQMTFSLKRYSIQRCWHRWRKRLVQDEARNCAMWRGAGWFRCRPNFFLEPQDDWPASSSPASLEAEQGAWYVNLQVQGSLALRQFLREAKKQNAIPADFGNTGCKHKQHFPLNIFPYFWHFFNWFFFKINNQQELFFQPKKLKNKCLKMSVCFLQLYDSYTKINLLFLDFSSAKIWNTTLIEMILKISENGWTVDEKWKEKQFVAL